MAQNREEGGGSSHCGLKRLDRPSTSQRAWSLELEVGGDRWHCSQKGGAIEHSSDWRPEARSGEGLKA